MAVLTSDQTNLVFFLVTLFVVFVSILGICVSYWTELSSDNDDSNYGIFFRETSGDEVVHSGCKSDMSEEDCSYLNAAKSCIVISILLGTVNVFIYMYNGGNPGFSFQSFTMGLIGMMQATFLMMCVIIYSYFKEGYLETNDDINIEYPDEVVDASYGWAFVLMVVVTVVSYMSSTYHLCALSWPAVLVKDSGADNGEDVGLVRSFDA
mmetsp:Transcript_18872/g.31495  ORF Transcript_18872/g.31495 Transcript_18872/m.31495 type:complete len:208 (+) Transcript_18872:138-761(+)|eukprot:CAMPEP_0114430312 /NCGR_PEP_ID=MMETSP0103-20121206/9974_1 /TAXON_ID=37642 ORGANISM="Paraphysomonas imperforata, Strain PA2" /NCGR_SAMPLE_ID=MMETSP0103 /ASSEMBLY_ACC=CAM_ASM_000201 /LENGTH=207 /DNA_ID=CAMNT_0001599751 /DNA_START=97 /DNA_END=720 /DNA_ORIENTATION=+